MINNFIKCMFSIDCSCCELFGPVWSFGGQTFVETSHFTDSGAIIPFHAAG